MSYYQGDFYRGDFYQGDPGVFGVLKGLAGAAAGFIPGVGPIASGLIKAIPSGGASTGRAAIASSMLRLPAGTALMKGAGTSLIRRGVAAVKGHPVLSAAGAAGAIGAGGLAVSPSLRKTAGRMLMGGHKKRRRMNVCNPRALRRSIRRTQGFAKLAMRTIHIVHPKKRGTFGGFRRRRTGARSRR